MSRLVLVTRRDWIQDTTCSPSILSYGLSRSLEVFSVPSLCISLLYSPIHPLHQCLKCAFGDRGNKKREGHYTVCFAWSDAITLFFIDALDNLPRLSSKERKQGRGRKRFYLVLRGGAKKFGPAIFPFCSPLPVINDRSLNVYVDYPLSPPLFPNPRSASCLKCCTLHEYFYVEPTQCPE